MQCPESQIEIDIFAERTYSRRGSGPLQSVSYAQRPDIAIEVNGPSGGTAVYLFDPKYKLDGERAEGSFFLEGSSSEEPFSDSNMAGRPKKPDIDKMHAYRDAIRDATGNRVVEYAAILYPGPTETFSEGLEAISAQPGDATLLRQVVANRLRKALAGM
jgi:predicted component of viral defense system (DUF524 family)